MLLFYPYQGLFSLEKRLCGDLTAAFQYLRDTRLRAPSSPAPADARTWRASLSLTVAPIYPPAQPLHHVGPRQTAPPIQCETVLEGACSLGSKAARGAGGRRCAPSLVG